MDSANRGFNRVLYTYLEQFAYLRKAVKLLNVICLVSVQQEQAKCANSQVGELFLTKQVAVLFKVICTACNYKIQDLFKAKIVSET